MKVKLMADLERHVYETREQLAEALALAVGGLLAGGIATRGQAVVAVSGGSTPKRFFETLSHADIEWSKVSILLVDERIVPATHDRANAKLVNENFLINNAAAATLIPFAVDDQSPENCAIASAQLFGDALGHIDALVLGMGTDGHTASFFPGGDNLSQALDMDTDQSVISMRALGAGEPRLTLTLPAILKARFIALHIEGDEKMRVFDEAVSGDDENEMPVRAVLKNAYKPLNLFWAP